MSDVVVAVTLGSVWVKNAVDVKEEDWHQHDSSSPTDAAAERLPPNILYCRREARL
jgi:hypothetical protein